MTTTETKTRKEKLDDIAQKQQSIIQLITDIKDRYSEFFESELLLSNLNNASDQLHKINLLIATDKKSLSKESN